VSARTAAAGSAQAHVHVQLMLAHENQAEILHSTISGCRKGSRSCAADCRVVAKHFILQDRVALLRNTQHNPADSSSD
jgi:hypothetical protein